MKEITETFAISKERIDEIKNMELATLELIFKFLDQKLDLIKSHNHKSSSIVGIEVSMQLIYDIIMDKKIFKI